MKTPRSIEIESLAHFDALVAAGATTMRGWHVQSLDLRERSSALTGLRAGGALFLGCHFGPRVEDALRAGGALLFPALPGLPFDPYRGSLYTGEQLYAGIAAHDYERTPDALIYQWSVRTGTSPALHDTLATAMHDHAISDALDEQLTGPAAAGTQVVGVMGGHAAQRGGADYAQAARLGRTLARRGFLVATGGGPGVMEAVNLGAYLAPYDDAALEEALLTLAAVPGFRPSITAWARAAAAVLAAYPDGAASLGIPTWFYGHEPPNLFATLCAKYFANAQREAVLLARCTGGIIFLPGAAGTVQEIFQDACENYYAAQGAATPMVLVGRAHWERELPVAPLLTALAAGREMAARVHLVDTVDDAVALLTTA